MHPSPRARPSRRDFLRTTTAAAACLAGLPALGQTEEKKGDPYGGFTVGVQSYTFRNFKLEAALKQTQGLGLHYVEFSSGHLPLTSTPEQIQAVLRLCKDYEITPVAYGVEHFSSNHDENRKRFDFAKALGIKYLSASPTTDAFDSLDKLCEEYKIAIAIHPHGPTGRGQLDHWYSAEVILEAVKDHHPLIGTCLDTGHLIRAAQEPFNKRLDPAQQVRLMGARNFGMHLKDHDNKARHDVIFGQGVLDVPAVVKALRDVKFKGYISIEYEHHPEDPAEDVKACLAVLRKAVANG